MQTGAWWQSSAIAVLELRAPLQRCSPDALTSLAALYHRNQALRPVRLEMESRSRAPTHRSHFRRRSSARHDTLIDTHLPLSHSLHA